MWIDLNTLTAFLGVSMLITLMPGPDNLLVLTLGMSKGPRAALPLALGLAFGNFFHSAAVALGLSALIAASPNALLAVKWLGGAYLLYIAYQIATVPSQIKATVKTSLSAHDQQLTASSSQRYFLRGLIMNLLNPKVILFFLAFLPQFIAHNAGAIPSQIMLLGAVFVLQTAVIFSAIALLAGKISNLFSRRPAANTILKWLTVLLLCLLSLKLLIQDFGLAS